MLAQIARDLVAVMRRDVRTDWTVREDVRAKLRSSIKRLLVKYKYPPDKQPERDQARDGADGVDGAAVRRVSPEGRIVVAVPEMEAETVLLSEIIAELNDRFGLDLGTSDEILVIQQVVGLVEDPAMRQIALMNDESRFGQVADDRLDDIVAENAERNTEFMKVYFDNDEFRKEIKAAARRRAYQIITAPARDDALAKLRAEMNRATGG